MEPQAPFPALDSHRPIRVGGGAGDHTLGRLGPSLGLSPQAATGSSHSQQPWGALKRLRRGEFTTS